MQEFDLNLPQEITSWLFSGGTAWLEPLSPQPKNTPQGEKYSPGSTVYIAEDKRWEAKAKTISTFGIKESS